MAFFLWEKRDMLPPEREDITFIARALKANSRKCRRLQNKQKIDYESLFHDKASGKKLAIPTKYLFFTLLNCGRHKKSSFSVHHKSQLNHLFILVHELALNSSENDSLTHKQNSSNKSTRPSSMLYL